MVYTQQQPAQIAQLYLAQRSLRPFAPRAAVCDLCTFSARIVFDGVRAIFSYNISENFAQQLTGHDLDGSMLCVVT